MSKVDKAILDKQLERLRGDKGLLQAFVDMLALDPSEEADINRFVLQTVMNKYDSHNRTVHSPLDFPQ